MEMKSGARFLAFGIYLSREDTNQLVKKEFDGHFRQPASRRKEDGISCERRDLFVQCIAQIAPIVLVQHPMNDIRDQHGLYIDPVCHPYYGQFSSQNKLCNPPDWRQPRTMLTIGELCPII